MELSPFGVSVVTILLGTVATPFHANEPIPELPETSYYSKILETITKWAKNELGPKGGSAQELVNSIVLDIIGSNRTGIVWRGSYSGIIRFVTRWLPVSILVSIFFFFICHLEWGESIEPGRILIWSTASGYDDVSGPRFG